MHKIFLILGMVLVIVGGGVALWIFSNEQRENNPIMIVPSETVQEVLQEQETEKAQEKSFVAQEKVAIVFIGDIMLDRYIRTVAERRGYDFLLSDPEGVFVSSDLVVGNLEGPVTENPSRSVGSVVGSPNNYMFTFSPESLAFLTKNNMYLVNIGNNHIENFGEQGVLDTRRFLEAEGIEYFGAIGESSDIDSTVFERGGVKIALINYNAFSSVSSEETLVRIREKRASSDFVVVYTHWGNEYETQSSAREQQQARAFIDAGADAVLGSHPHVVQESEMYKGKTIYYSLGNAFFDQYFSEDVKEGLGVKAIFDPETQAIDFEEYSLILDSSGKTTTAKRPR